MMSIEKLKNKKIGILGLGIENCALIKYFLSQKIGKKIVIFENRKKEDLLDKIRIFKKNKNIKWHFKGSGSERDLGELDILFRSPGWPLFCPKINKALKFKNIKNKKEKNIFIYSPMKLFFDLCPTKKIIGVTGTKGKGTTASLIYKILKIAGKKVWLGGNIGIAPFDFFLKIKKTDWVVLELSSFQLEDVNKSPHIAILTNLYREHLKPVDPNNPNYHQTLNNYLEAKLNIAYWHNRNDFFILNSKFKSNLKLQSKIKKLKSKVLYFNKLNWPSRLIGEHNKENIAAAVMVAKIIGINEKIIKKAILQFKALENRLEFVCNYNGIKFYNDSFATTPEASITAIKSFNSPIVLIAGGADKGASFKILAREIKKYCRFVVLLDGEATLRLRDDLIKIRFLTNKMRLVKSIKEAVNIAVKKSKTGDVVLLSTACASFGMFKNYKERGKLFKKEVMNLKNIKN